MSAEVGLSVTQRRYVKYGDAHYGGNLVDGAYVLGMFGDVATELCIRTDADEGLFASYSDVQFRAPVPAARVRGAGRLPGRPGARRLGGLGAERARRRRDRGRHRSGARARVAFISPV
jgi:3-aminobutyryl-CoA ammonia-lyase